MNLTPNDATMKTLLLSTWLLGLLFIAGCSGGGETTPPSSAEGESSVSENMSEEELKSESELAKPE